MPDEIRMAIVSMKPGRTSASDCPVAEMLMLLDDAQLSKLAILFNLLLLNPKAAPISWKQILAVVIPKKARAKTLSQRRPISVLSVMQKLFNKVLLQRIADKLRDQSDFMFAYRPGHQPAEKLQSAGLSRRLPNGESPCSSFASI